MVERGDQEKMKECKFQPNIGKVVDAGVWKRS